MAKTISAAGSYFYSLSCGGEVCSCSTPILCSCSTTSSLTCSRPTSSSSISKRWILPRFTASARIAKAPIANAPTALAPTPKAPRAVHASPVATRANATCAPNGRCSFGLALCIFFTVLSFPTRLEKTLGANPFHHKHDATVRSPAPNFLELRKAEVLRIHLLRGWVNKRSKARMEPFDALLLTGPYVYGVGAVLLEAQATINSKAHGG